MKSGASNGRRSLLKILGIFLALMPGLLHGAGQKRAVIVGINTYPYANSLRGCVEDAKNVNALLTSEFGIPVGNVVLLTDGAATRAGILAALRDVAAKSQPGDLVVFYYSGHGSIFPDDLSEVHDETVILQQGPHVPRTGAYDSALCPSDTGGPPSSDKAWENLILDDELFAVFQPLASRGVTVLGFSDSCHSGSLSKALRPGWKVKFISPEQAVRRNLSLRPTASKGIGTLTFLREKAEKRYIFFGGCRDNSVSTDTPKGGLFTVSLVTVIKELSRSSKESVTYKAVFEKTRAAVLKDSDNEQEPTLDDRFWGAGLDMAMFNPLDAGPFFPTPPPGSDTLSRVVVRIRDKAGKPIPGAVFAILSPDVAGDQQKVTREGSLLLGKTNEKGIYDSGAVAVVPGSYRAKAAAAGYRAFEGRVELTHSVQKGTSILAFDLEKE